MPGQENDDAAAQAAGVDLEKVVEMVESQLLGGSREYTRAEIAERAGMPLDEARSLWRALGFATVSDDDRVFTEADVEALRRVHELSEIGGIDTDVMHAMTRIIGQTFARLASWQGQVVVDLIAENPELVGDDASGAVDVIDQITPLTSELHDYVWRRQLAAYFSRVASNAGAAPGDRSQTVPAAVGFADMAGFTTFTRQSSDADLRAVLDTFESMATDVIAANRGQIVKTIGDEVLFTADVPRDAAEIALALIEAAEGDDRMPPLRAGIGFGAVVRRLGDVYGQTVNIASRLTSVARTGTVLVDVGMHERLDGDQRYTLSPLRPVSVRGYHHLRSWRLRHASD
jgi:adenylate cyclase